MITTHRERIVLVELLHAEYAHAHPTNGMRCPCIVIVIVLVIAAVGPGLRTHNSNVVTYLAGNTEC